MTETRERQEIYRHGSQPVAVSYTGVWTPRRSTEDEGWVRPTDGREPPEPQDRDGLTRSAPRPLRPFATVPVVGLEGGIGRTSVVRLLCQALADLRTAPVAAVDAVPMWGGLSTSLPPRTTEWSIKDLARMPWPTTTPDDLRDSAFVKDGLVHTLRGKFVGQPGWPSHAEIIEAVRRVNTMFELTVVDTPADPFGDVAGRLILTAHTTPVWVCSATRDGLWGVTEAIAHIDRERGSDVAQRSVIAVVGTRRRWPSPAAAAEAQLSAGSVPIVRLCIRGGAAEFRASGRRLASAVIERSR